MKRIDTIPPSVKEYFFRGKEMPNLSWDYDAIGFDADHCLVKYHLRNLHELLIRTELEDLVEHEGYPKEMLEFDISAESIEI